MLRQAEDWKRLLDAGGVNQADLARLHGLSRARVTQSLNLLKLHPSILEYIRHPASGSDLRLTERKVRPLIRLTPDEQLRLLAENVPIVRRYVGGRGAELLMAEGGAV